MSFEVGDIVVCVDDSSAYSPKHPQLTEGHRYQIRGHGPLKGSFYEASGIMVKPEFGDGVLLVGVIRPHDGAFKPERFRKLIGPCELQRVEAMRKEPVGV